MDEASALVRNTLVPVRLSAGVSNNIVPPVAEAELNCR
jgi:hypothetical protein